LVTLTMSPDREFQWAISPFSNPNTVTDWSFRTPAMTWYHVALVNDGKTTDLYINGSKDVRNSHDLSVGLQTIGAAERTSLRSRPRSRSYFPGHAAKIEREYPALMP
jgi:Concanavalin A-like lectin/glucanases superfamily